MNQLAEDVRKLRGRIKVIHPSGSVSSSDEALFLDALALRNALLSDLLPATQAASSFWRGVCGIKSIDVQAYFEDWKTLDVILKTSVEESSAAWWDWRVFKQLAQDGIHNTWILSSLRPFFLAIDSPDQLFIKLNQWINWDSHLNFRDLDLKSACCLEYLESERAMSSWEYPSLLELRSIVSDWFADYAPAENFCPKHGPGAVREVAAGRPSAPAKTSHFCYDDELREFVEQYLWDDITTVLYDPAYQPPDSQWRTCTLICVPKSPLKNRTISKEPVTLQWCQQGLRFGLDEYFSTHRHLHIDLHDQLKSRELARLGALTGEYATIDLSNASDSVTLPLVEEVFADTDLLPALLATRSRYCDVSYDDRTVRVQLVKFAPMGSSLCFPVECIVFASICEQAVRNVSGRRSQSDDYQVYGDDIVIRTPYAAECIRLLELYHFSVNTRKSFSGIAVWRFREACGLESINGLDATPLRLSRRLLAPSRKETLSEASSAAGLIELTNLLDEYSYRNTRRVLNSGLRSAPWFFSVRRVDRSDINLVAAERPYFIVDDTTATQYRVPSRYSRKLHRVEYFCSTFTVRYQDDPDDGYLDDRRLFLWYWDKYRQSVTESLRPCAEVHVEPTVIPRGTQRVRWTREWVG